MKEHIAEASIASTNLINTLQSINREHERISDNKMALQRFENAKQLRRKILRYVSFQKQAIGIISTDTGRFIMLSRRSGWAAFLVPTTSLSLL